MKSEREKMLKVLMSPPELDGISIRLDKLEAIFNEANAEEIAEIREKVEALGIIMYGRNHEVDDAIHREHVLALLPKLETMYERVHPLCAKESCRYPEEHVQKSPNTRKGEGRRISFGNWSGRRGIKLSRRGEPKIYAKTDRRIEDRRAEAS